MPASAPPAPPGSHPPAARPRVAVAGASGFVGRALVDALRTTHDVIALRRTPEGVPAREGVETRPCDLFSLLDAERGLEGASAAVYLVHAMMPSARLTQGRFDDLDLLCADNFARAAKTAGVGHVVYLGGLLPDEAGGSAREVKERRARAESRLEVERTLAAYGVPVTTLRTGLVLGAGGPSFEITRRLAERWALLVGPRWLGARAQVVGLDRAVALLAYTLARPELAGRAYDVGDGDAEPYAELVRATAAALGRRPRVVPLPLGAARTSVLAVRLLTGVPRALVRPLVASLHDDLVARDGLALQRDAGLPPRPLAEVLAVALAASADADEAEEADRGRRVPDVAARRAAARHTSLVRSVQRMPLPAGRNARWVAEEYARWLPRLLHPFLRVDVDADGGTRFVLRPLRAPILALELSHERSADDRQLYYVKGGLLARVLDGSRARLEFRTVLDGRCVVAALHDFAPRLPWSLYKVTQAVLHLFVMRRFAKHLARLAAAA